MTKWPKHPLIYEINTWVWLGELSRAYGRSVSLADVPSSEWVTLADLGADAVWLMGVWERSPAGIRIAMTNAALLANFRRALPDFEAEDIIGSPYCVRRYVVDERLGGPKGLADARLELAQRGMRLILDYVPNHVAPDHPWTDEHPEYFIHGTKEDLSGNPAAFLEVGDNIIACGRDPHYPAWPDVHQLNAFHPGLRQAVAKTLEEVASQCDGLRCDMAMLVMNAIFERTWGERAGEKPEREYWPQLIRQVKERYPDILFIAEAYWDLEWELMQQGFDYCYDKRLYDRLEHGDAKSVRLHLLADLSYQEKLVRFIENHDEPRAAATFSPEKERAAAVVAMTLPGAKLIHEGQLEGRKIRLPMFLGRRPQEPVDGQLKSFYQKLLQAIQTEAIRNGEWRLCEQSGWPDNQSQENLLAWCWRKNEERHLIVVNLSPGRSQGLVQVPWNELRGRNWHLKDVLFAQDFERSGNEMLSPGLYVDLDGWKMHFFDVVPENMEKKLKQT
jgi:glycosidase